MTQEEQRITIAEACGWKLTDIDLTYPTGLKIAFHPPDYVKDVFLKDSPDYLNDLNACAEFEKVLTFHQETEYVANLMRQHKDYPTTKGFLATAAQRCEAFLRTLNLWHE